MSARPPLLLRTVWALHEHALQSRWRGRIVAVCLVVIVLCTGYLARDRVAVVLDPLEAPDTLAGLPALPASSSQPEALRAVTEQLVQDVGPDGVVQPYGDPGGAVVVLAASRGAVAPERTRDYLAAFGHPISTDGTTSCGTDEHGDLSVCMRTGDGRTVTVLLLGRSGLSPEAALAAAWRGTE